MSPPPLEQKQTSSVDAVGIVWVANLVASLKSQLRNSCSDEACPAEDEQFASRICGFALHTQAPGPRGTH